jgi:hypothetical protein
VAASILFPVFWHIPWFASVVADLRDVLSNWRAKLAQFCGNFAPPYELATIAREVGVRRSLTLIVVDEPLDRASLSRPSGWSVRIQ